jgi:RecB family exonuclease
LAAGQPDPQPLLDSLDILQRAASLAQEPALPAEWPARLAPLALLVAGPTLTGSPDPASFAVWRARAAALRGFQSALAEAAALLPSEPLDLAAFWELARDTLDAVALRLPPLQRDAVALLDVQEARQWELPYVFLCGLIEGEFPRAPQPDPILDEETRARLAAHGFFLTTLRDREQQESFLFRVALSRATRETVLLYPRRDAKGDELLPSFELAHLSAAEEPARPARLDAGAPPPRRSYAQRIQQPALLAALRQRHRRHLPTAIETFLACPFQFFASQTLQLQLPPPDPSDRLDLRAAGILLHRVIERWHRESGPILSLFEQEWTAFLQEKRIREGFRTAAYHLQLERSLAAYAQDPRLQAGWRVATEERVTLEIQPGEDREPIVIEGRIDRCDTSPGGECQIFDLKYTNSRGLKSRVKQQQADRAVQGGLYTLAMEARGLRPAAFHLAALREGAEFHTWEGEDLEALKTQARELTVQAATAIRGGEVAPRPADPDVCAWCNYRDACRIHEAAAEDTAQAAG